MSKLTVLNLTLFRGRVAYDEKGTPISENQPYSVVYDSFEWNNFKKTLSFLGISSIKVVSGLSKTNSPDDKGELIPASDLKKYDDEIQSMLKKVVEKPKTEEQKKIEALEKQIESLINASKPKEPKPVNNTVLKEESELEELRAEYEATKGEKPHHKMSVETLKEKLGK